MGSIRLAVTGVEARHAGALSAYLSSRGVFEVVDADSAEVLITGEYGIAGRRPVLVIGPDDPAAMIAAIEAGAQGYLPDTASLDEVARAVEAVHSGEGVVPPLMLGALLRHVVQRQRARRSELERLDLLTDREREVFELLAQGLDRGSIAQRLFISVGTVRSHLQNVFKKLEVHSHAEAVAFAARCGVSLDDAEGGA